MSDYRIVLNYQIPAIFCELHTFPVPLVPGLQIIAKVSSIPSMHACILFVHCHFQHIYCYSRSVYVCGGGVHCGLLSAGFIDSRIEAPVPTVTTT